jgi:hypothetical protein
LPQDLSVEAVIHPRAGRRGRVDGLAAELDEPIGRIPDVRLPVAATAGGRGPTIQVVREVGLRLAEVSLDVVAKAERVDTTQLELEFAAKLAALDALAGLVDADGDGPGALGDEGSGDGTRRGRGGSRGSRRDPRQAPVVVEERLEITDPSLEGTAERIGVEECSELVWRRGGFVRLVISRIK